MRWKPYIDQMGQAFPLNHLHPFRYNVILEGTVSLPQKEVQVHVGFGMHCFTRKTQPNDPPGSHYSDSRETRTFCVDRYRLSRTLPKIIHTLDNRRCGFAKNNNYITVNIQDTHGPPLYYAVFFNMRGLKTKEGNSVSLIVQSAYALSSGKQNPGSGRVGFNVLLGHALRGTKPRRPR